MNKCHVARGARHVKCAGTGTHPRAPSCRHAPFACWLLAPPDIASRHVLKPEASRTAVPCAFVPPRAARSPPRASPPAPRFKAPTCRRRLLSPRWAARGRAPQRCACLPLCCCLRAPRRARWPAAQAAVKVRSSTLLRRRRAAFASMGPARMALTFCACVPARCSGKQRRGLLERGVQLRAVDFVGRSRRASARCGSPGADSAAVAARPRDAVRGRLRGQRRHLPAVVRQRGPAGRGHLHVVRPDDGRPCWSSLALTTASARSTSQPPQ